MKQRSKWVCLVLTASNIGGDFNCNIAQVLTDEKSYNVENFIEDLNLYSVSVLHESP